MREIKFRGWDGERMLSPQDLSQSGDFWRWLGKQDVELMQYTGLKDREGREIYESDIVKEGDLIGVIGWHDDYARFRYTHETGSAGLYCFYGEVIGNIYENPELLEAS
jgi:hypothetical protein